MARLLLILLDGLSLPGADKFFCFPEALCRAGQAKRYVLPVELPPISRPAYATILTGKTPLEHGILRNDANQKLTCPTFFDCAVRNGCTTAAAAYHWFFELCNCSPWRIEQNRAFDNPAMPIQHGIFYGHDGYPDAELFADAEVLRMRYDPDLLLIHPMGIDFAGHSGCEKTYFDACAAMDDLLAQWLPLWQKDARILVTSDHGMGSEGCHHLMAPSVLRVPLWLVGEGWPDLDSPSQMSIYDLVLSALEINL